MTNSIDGTARDTKRFDLKTIIFVAICLIGFVFYALFNKQVFPSASIDMKMDQSEAGKQSRLFAEKLGYDLKDNLSSTTFTIDDDAKTVLEFKLGIAEANRVMKDQVPVWLWHTRFCKPLSNDQLYVDWTTNGLFESFNHLFANDRKFQTITQDEALSKAKDFVKNVAKFDLTGYDLFDRGSESKPNRTDHHFVWRKAAYPECERRVRIEVAGNQVSSYRYFLSPTDTWTREYTKIRELNDLLGTIASFFLMAFLVAAFICFVLALTKHAIRWRFVLILSGAVATLSFLDQINGFSTSFVDSYNTSISFLTFVAQTTMSYLLLSLLGFLASIFIVGGAEYVYRTCFPKEVAFSSLFTWKGMAQSDYRRKIAMGYLLPGLMMFWMITYYKMGEKIGYFCPLGVDDYRVIGNYFPALSGAMIGVSAAGLEELSCRVVALGLLQRFLKNFWVANFLQAVIWGFAHSQYPQEPCYARGVELTVIGLIFGAVVRSFGILPTIVAHYLYDAFLTVEPVLGSHNVLLIIPSIAILLPFALAPWWGKRWALKNHFDAEQSDLTNFSVEHTAPPPQHQADREDGKATAHSAFTKSTRIKLLVAMFFGFGSLAIPAGKELGEDTQLTTTAHQALLDAEKYLSQDGYALNHFQHVVQLIGAPTTNDKNSFQYLYEKAGFEKTKKIYDRVEPGLEWYVRFFKPEETKAYWVYMNGDGSKRETLFYDIDEGAGAFLNRDAAFGLVESYLKKNRPELLPYTIDTETKTIRPKRIDYAFDLLEPQLTAGEAKAKIRSEIKGDKLANLAIQWDLPDAWSWPHQQRTWYQQAAYVLLMVEGIVAIVALIWWGIHILRITAIPWRSVAMVAGIGFVLNLAAVLNKLPSELVNYNTAKSFASFVGQSIAMDLLRLMLSVAVLAIVWAVALPALKMSFPAISRQLKRTSLIAPVLSEQKSARLLLVFDATISSLSLLGLMAALRHFQSLALSQFSPEVKIDFPSFVLSLMNSQSPFLESILAVALAFIWIVPTLIIAASFWRQFLLKPYRSAAVILLTAATSATFYWYAETAAIAVIFSLLRGFTMLYFATRVFKLNSLSYIFFALETVALTYLNELISHASSVTMPEIILLALIVVMPVLITIVLWLKSRSIVAD